MRGNERAVNAVSGKASRQSHGAAGFQGNYWSAENEASPQPTLSGQLLQDHRAAAEEGIQDSASAESGGRI